MDPMLKWQQRNTAQVSTSLDPRAIIRLRVGPSPVSAARRFYKVFLDCRDVYKHVRQDLTTICLRLWLFPLQLPATSRHLRLHAVADTPSLDLGAIASAQ